MLVEVLTSLSGASFSFKRAPFSLVISWFPGEIGEKKLLGVMTRLRGLWSTIRTCTNIDGTILCMQLEKRRRLCGLLYKRLSDSFNDTNFVPRTVINDDEANFVVSNTTLPTSLVRPLIHSEDQGKVSNVPLHITFSYSRQAEAQPSIVECFARKLSSSLRAKVWLYETGSSTAIAANNPQILERQEEMLKPEERELYVNDERLLRQDAGTKCHE